MSSSNSSGVVVATTKAAVTADAAAEIARQLTVDGLAMVLVFVSPFYDPHRFVAEMTTHFAGKPVFGCTTAGELAPDGWEENSIVALGFSAVDFTVVAQTITDIANFRIEDGHTIGAELRQEMLQQTARADGERCFGIVLVDGMCKREEVVTSALYASLSDIPVVGGSAGDGLRFGPTWVFADGRACTNAAALILVRTPLPFCVFKSDSFEPTSTKMVVTAADPERRIVQELNAEPAAEEYSRAAGVADARPDLLSFASHPVLVRAGGTYHARSILGVDPDGALHFACAIDEGMVLTAATSRNPVEATLETFSRIRDEIGDVSICICFESILRRLDTELHQLDRTMSDLYRDNRVIGFHTYGEQYGSMHVNQTLTGVAIGRRPRPGESRGPPL